MKSYGRKDMTCCYKSKHRNNASHSTFPKQLHLIWTISISFCNVLLDENLPEKSHIPDISG